MAKHLRILGVASSKTPAPMEEFIDGLKSGGWGDQVAIPIPHDGVCGFDALENDTATGPPRCGICECKAWGSIFLPDIRLMTRDGVTPIGDCKYLPAFSHESLMDQATAIIASGSYLVKSRMSGTLIHDVPGLFAPEPSDTIACLIAESRGGLPVEWFKKVIDNTYDSGLRFFFRCFDLTPVGNDGEIGSYAVFYSMALAAESDPLTDPTPDQIEEVVQDHEFKISTHCEAVSEIPYADGDPLAEPTPDQIKEVVEADGEEASDIRNEGNAAASEFNERWYAENLIYGGTDWFDENGTRLPRIVWPRIEEDIVLRETPPESKERTK